MSNRAHYTRLDPQPVEYMKQAMTQEQFEGFCLGNILKYALRYGYKDDKSYEVEKIRTYADYLLNSIRQQEEQK